MVFSSLIFLWIFLPLVFFGNLLAGRKLSNLFLLLASLFFYAWGEPVMVLLMFVCCLWNWAAGLLISRSKHKKLSLALGVTLDLSFLFYYKYIGFFCDIVNSVGGGSILPRPEVALPIGISFFTFQAISYLADVYRGQVAASKDPLPVALYISFFPQLIAGPIVQYRSVEAALRERRVTTADTADGFRRFVYGLSKKVLIANVLAGCADKAFALEALDMRAAWIGALAYTLQIYYDFSGYSDMAIGLGKMFGFTFPENFRYPYLSRSISEFWRRWHITLGAWFREYVYIPLGGNRKGRGRTLFNLMLVFALTGLWHGAELSFILWGLYHGLLSLIERVGLKKLLEKSRVISRLLCFCAVLLGWVLFRAENCSEAFRYLAAMFTPGAETVPLWQLGDRKCFIFLILAIPGAGLIQTLVPEKLRTKYTGSVIEALICMLLLFFCVASLAADSYNPFIYFQF